MLKIVAALSMTLVMFFIAIPAYAGCDRSIKDSDLQSTTMAEAEILQLINSSIEQEKSVEQASSGQ